MTVPFSRRWPFYLLVAASLLTALIALRNAVAWYGHPVGGMFLDPGGIVSNIGLPYWDWRKEGLSFPDRILQVDGHRLEAGSGAPRVRAWDDAVERAFKSGRRSVDVVIQTHRGVRTVPMRVHPLEPFAWWICAGSLLFAGFLYAAGGLIALWISPGSALARAFAQVGLSTGALVGLTFDFHTTRTLAPVFLIAFAMVPVSWVMLALRLPDDVPILQRIPRCGSMADGVGALTAGTFVYLYYSGRETLALQQVCTVALGASLLFFGGVFIVRFVKSRGIRRDRLRALLISVVPPHVAIGVLIFPKLQGDVAQVVIFSTLSLFPLATAFAFVRYDLWGSGALLSRILTRLGVGALACIVAIGFGAIIATEHGAALSDALLAASLASIAAAVLVIAALGALDRYLFVARVQYKPTVDVFSQELISITSPEEVARTVERTIRRWLPCDLIQLSLTPPGGVPPGAEGGLRVLDGGLDVGVRKLSLPVEFAGVRLGRLRVGEKPGRALFTRDDIDLLHTIVNQGALALAHAYAYAELEQRRREQAAAFRGERAAIIETVATEIAHEIRYPINFFRSVFEGGGAVIGAEEVETGREEVDRLERLVAGLKRMAVNRIERRSVSLKELCTRVETLLRDSLGERRLDLSIPDNVEIACDPDQTIQILVNLASNALQAVGQVGSVGVAWSQSASDAELVVWDTGPGFEGDGSRLFAPWYTTKPGGTGLGLAITHRLVRAHGWTISAKRRDKHTLFVVRIRREDFVVHDRAAGGTPSAGMA